MQDLCHGVLEGCERTYGANEVSVEMIPTSAKQGTWKSRAARLDRARSRFPGAHQKRKIQQSLWRERKLVECAQQKTLECDRI
jgi:hypothetical protein